ncbi:NYN domain-containing protein [Piscinibacter sakaiensis]|uniref:NYN domain-containing protein n=1 Tax=Piscinibacter sakaiensis TaxID=1547922 RepID=UPI0037286E44
MIDQALEHVIARHGGAHVRRAYCTCELALKHLRLFKALSIRPIVNISTGKNSTDIALAVDAIDLVLAERPDIVVLVSSDSDFAPLVVRLREKGCRVEGIGQEGKTGADSKTVYDDFLDLPYRRPRVAAGAIGTAAADARGPSLDRLDGGREAGRWLPPDAGDPAVDDGPHGDADDNEDGAEAGAPVSRVGSADPAGPATATGEDAAPRADDAARPDDDEVARVLAALPELRGGARVQLNLAKDRLVQAGLLSRSAPSTKVFRRHPDQFELTPPATPNAVRYRGG